MAAQPDSSRSERRSYPEDLTDEERRAIDTLVRLGKRWPKTLRLFSWSGTLKIEDMRRSNPEVGEIRTIDNVPAIRILNDGGDPDEAD